MTDTQEKILKNINYYKRQLKELPTVFLKYRDNFIIDKEGHFFIDTEQEKKIFDDFKANLQKHYGAQIDSLIAELSA